MKTLEQIKNDYSIIQCYTDWKDLVYDLGYDNPSRLIRLIDEVMKIYAMECLKLASKNVTTVHHKLQTKESIINAIHLTKQSITNENNIIK